MRPEVRQELKALCTGATLSTLFFYPLIEALESNRYYLQWQQRDNLELALAGIVLALLSACAEWLIARRASPRVRLLGRLMLLVVPLMSLVAALLRVLDPEGVALQKMNWLVPLLSISGLGTLLLVSMSRRVCSVLANGVSRGLLILCPISLIFLWTVLHLAELSSLRARPPRPGADPTHLGPPASVVGIYILVFDELSYHFVYDSNAQIRESLVNLSSLARTSSHYHNATSPGESTLRSLTGLLALRRGFSVRIAGEQLLEDTGSGPAPLDMSGPSTLAGMVRQLGFRMEIFGWYNPYCDLLAGAADLCRSVSMYNVASAADRFSILHPLLTTVNIWPHQLPTGLAKNPVALAYHKDMLRLLTEAASSPARERRPLVRLVHFNIAHGPFIGACSGFGCDPFDPTDANYLAQLTRVDEAIGTVRAALEQAHTWDQSVIVVTSDHEFRRRTPPAEYAHVPLIVKRQGQLEREDVVQDTQTETVIAQIVRAYRVRP